MFSPVMTSDTAAYWDVCCSFRVGWQGGARCAWSIINADENCGGWRRCRVESFTVRTLSKLTSNWASRSYGYGHHVQGLSKNRNTWRRNAIYNGSGSYGLGLTTSRKLSWLLLQKGWPTVTWLSRRSIYISTCIELFSTLNR